MKIGKLTTNELNDNVISLLKHVRDEVKCSAQIGEDCALIDGEGLILISSDPITAPVEIDKLGALCVSVCCNDIASNGGEPIAMTMTLILPPTCNADTVKAIMLGAVEKATELKVEIVGGHTEFSDCVVRPIACGTAIGKTTKPLLKNALKMGDAFVVSKSLAMEGTCIIVDADKPKLSESERACYELFSKSLDVTNESKILSKLDCVTVMHDITEGGILGAVAEICHNQGLGATLYADEMPISVLTKRMCQKHGIDPLRLISSGSMLIATSQPETVIEELAKNGIESSVVGKVTDNKMVIVSDGKEVEFDVMPDELYKRFGETK